MAKLPFTLVQKMRKRVPVSGFSGFVTKPLPISYRLAAALKGTKQLVPFAIASFALGMVIVSFIRDFIE